MVVVLALVAALFLSLGTVLEQQVASRAPEAETVRAGFLVRLARQPRWVAGLLADAIGFAVQAAALSVGRLVVVQPLQATVVVFALPLNAVLGGRKPSARELGAATVVTAGLAVFLIAAEPTGGVDDPAGPAWIASVVVCGTASALLALVARGRRPALRAILLGMASGIMWGLFAALLKATVESFDEGLQHVLADWHLYALIAVGYVAMTLGQSAYQTGALAPALATQMSFDPITSLLLGLFAFDETIHESTAGLVVAVAAFAAVICALVYLVLSQQKAVAA
jgi:drug/metabolite transporter (DMT)-like permease